MSTQKPHPILRGKRIYFRSHPRTRAALRRVVANLQASEEVRFLGDEPTQEAIVNASWLLLESMGVPWLVEHLGPMLRRIEEMGPSIPAGHVPPPDEGRPLGPPKVESVRPTERDADGDHDRPQKRRRPPQIA